VPRLRHLAYRRLGPLGLALTAYDIWRRIPPAQRRQLLAATRKHGPRLAANAVERGRKLRAVRRDKRP
jgi:hypothetical protein